MKRYILQINDISFPKINKGKTTLFQVQKFSYKNKERYNYWKKMYIDDAKQSSAPQKGFMEISDDSLNYSKINTIFNLSLGSRIDDKMMKSSMHALICFNKIWKINITTIL